MEKFKVASCQIKNRNKDSAAAAFAESELAKYLGKITAGAEANESGGVISIGISSDHLGEEAFSIASADDGVISITGGGERGLLYGVYAFLEKYAGCRFLAAGVDTVPHNPSLALGLPVEYTESPVMEYRDLHWTCSFDTDWAAKNMLNSKISRPLEDKRGGGI
jgi:hypothetical protein